MKNKQSMKRIILLATIGIASLKTTAQVLPEYTVKMSKKIKAIESIVIYEPKTGLNQNDSALIIFLNFIAKEIDSTLVGEEFDIAPNNGKGVTVYGGLRHHNIFLATSRNGETVMLLMSDKMIYGGILTTKDDDGIIKKEKIVRTGMYAYIGENHGRFEFPTKKVFDVEFDDGLPMNYRKK